jgi:hypothetical protein
VGDGPLQGKCCLRDEKNGKQNENERCDAPHFI